MDSGSILGMILAPIAVFGGHLLGGGHLGEIVQLTAAFIVLVGTMAAVLLSYPFEQVRRAFDSVPSIFQTVNQDVRPLISEIVKIAGIVRKDGMLAIETQARAVQDPLLSKALKFVIDGLEAGAVQEIITGEIRLAFDEDAQAAKVFEGAGAIAPAVGIIGAVLGLIHVMTLLNEPSKIGSGIAVAFVSTIYGIALANLVLTPIGTKLKRQAQLKMLPKEVVRLGIAGIQEGINPSYLQEKLEIFVRSGSPGLAGKS